MAGTMMTFAQRRGLWVGLLVVAVVASALWLPANQFLTGWVLLALMVALTVFNGRKKLPFLPLGHAETWLQFHIYAGLFTGALFLIHLGYRWPHGWFNLALAGLYLAVMVSGILGWVWSRTYPKRLTARGGEVLFERIPIIRRALREEAEALARKSIAETKSTIIADFYMAELHQFFAGPCNAWAHRLELRGPLYARLARIEHLNRFVGDAGRAITDRLAELVRQKDGLDYQQALQTTLRLWLFVHVPLTYALLLLSLAHLVIVYAFSGGAR